MKHRKRLLLSDYAGHAFTYELACALHDSGQSISYSYCATTVSPKGSMAGSCPAVPVTAGGTFDKYKLSKRLLSEVRYGFNLGRFLWRSRPQVHVVCNMPLVSMLVFWAMALPLRIRLVIWFQDAQSGIALGVLGKGAVTSALTTLEGFMLRRARRVIAISDELAEEARRQRVRPARLGVIENWAPLEAIPMLDHDNSWSRAHGLDTASVFLYSGTLARKHRPEVLIDLTRTVRAGGGKVVVVSEGEGADSLAEEQQRADDLDNLVVLPYQPFEELPEVLATADVLVVLLEHLAGKFSVPSKTLSYLCAGRPILGSMPLDNTAAAMITARAHAGFVTAPENGEAFQQHAVELLNDAELRAQLGAAGRAFAEVNFRRDVVVDRFLAELDCV